MVAKWESVTAELFDAGLQPTLITDLTVVSSLDRSGPHLDAFLTS
jgi:hypothetical protein